MPQHHPEFLYELMSLGNYKAVQFIMYYVMQIMKQIGHISKRFSMNLSLLGKIFTEEQLQIEELASQHKANLQEYQRKVSYLEGENNLSEEARGNMGTIRLLLLRYARMHSHTSVAATAFIFLLLLLGCPTPPFQPGGGVFLLPAVAEVGPTMLHAITQIR